MKAEIIEVLASKAQVANSRQAMSRFEQEVTRIMAGRARSRARSDEELYDSMLKFAIADARSRGFSELRVRYIAREFLREIH